MKHVFVMTNENHPDGRYCVCSDRDYESQVRPSLDGKYKVERLSLLASAEYLLKQFLIRLFRLDGNK